MAVVQTIDGDVVMRGGLYGLTDLDYPAGSIQNADVAANAALAASKSQQHFCIPICQVSTAADETRFAHVVRGATGTLKDFRAGCFEANIGASYVTLDLKKNGASILTGVVTLNVTTGTGTVAGVIQTTGVVVGDILTVVINGEWSGSDALAKGVWAQVTLDQDYP